MRPLPRSSSRRRFIHVGGGIVSGATVAPLAAGAAPAAAAPHGGWFPAGDAPLRVGLVGCGGRGIGATVLALGADPSVRIVAVGDLFADQAAAAVEAVGRATADRPGGPHPAPRRFVGAEACAGVLAARVDLVMLATPPAGRPGELEAAVAAGCHMFCEAPLAIDAGGCLRAARALAVARHRRLAVGSGLAFRHDDATAAVIGQIQAGAIGRPRSLLMATEAGLPWRVPHRPGMSGAEWRQRNWISFADLGGGPLLERQVHAIDKALWALGEEVPVSATGQVLPGRRDRRSIGDVTDGLSIRYHFASGVGLHVLCLRNGTGEGLAEETVHGSGGTADLRAGIVTRHPAREATLSFGPCGSDGSRYRASIGAVVGAIRSGVPLDEGSGLVRATAVALLGRSAAHAGTTVGWADAGLPADGTNRPFDTAVTIGQAVNIT
jgi:predicted dehydrogenase